MRVFKQIIISALITVAGLSLCGCRVFGFEGKDLKDVVLGAMDNAMQGFSKNVLTRKYRLTGDKTEGITAYEGTYEANYNDFSGKETLFGSTALNLDKNIKLKLDYELNSKSGECCLFRVSSDGVTIIATRGSGETEIVIEPGDNYIIFQGDRFTGELRLSSVNVSGQP